MRYPGGSTPPCRLNEAALTFASSPTEVNREDTSLRSHNDIALAHRQAAALTVNVADPGPPPGSAAELWGCGRRRWPPGVAEHEVVQDGHDVVAVLAGGVDVAADVQPVLGGVFAGQAGRGGSASMPSGL